MVLKSSHNLPNLSKCVDLKNSVFSLSHSCSAPVVPWQRGGGKIFWCALKAEIKANSSHTQHIFEYSKYFEVVEIFWCSFQSRDQGKLGNPFQVQLANPIYTFQFTFVAVLDDGPKIFLTW